MTNFGEVVEGIIALIVLLLFLPIFAQMFPMLGLPEIPAGINLVTDVVTFLVYVLVVVTVVGVVLREL